MNCIQYLVTWKKVFQSWYSFDSWENSYHSLSIILNLAGKKKK